MCFDLTLKKKKRKKEKKEKIYICIILPASCGSSQTCSLLYLKKVRYICIYLLYTYMYISSVCNSFVRFLRHVSVLTPVSPVSPVRDPCVTISFIILHQSVQNPSQIAFVNRVCANFRSSPSSRGRGKLQNYKIAREF